SHNSNREVALRLNESILVAKSLVDKNKFTSLIIFGDFNHPNIEWNNDGGKCESRYSQSCEFLETFRESNFLRQVVIEPNLGNNVLDLIIIDDPNRIYNLEQKLTNKPLYLYDKCNSDLFNEHICKINWAEEDSKTNVDSFYETIIRVYSEASEMSIPTFYANSKLKPKWLNKDLKDLCRKKFSLWSKIRASTKNEQLRKEYNRLCKILKKFIKTEKQKFEATLAKIQK
ncbi:RNA-directed DNA polymerase from mobile element jockey-like, partial [Brachionus plicatilis]